jgi:hypothetical protein
MANRKISDLTALTAPATGDLLPIVDISEAAAADKNKKITYGELLASAPAGSAAAPSFSFDGDPNSGLYSAGADQVAISTNGTGRVFVNASGNVGVGNSAPGSLLTVRSASSPTITVENNTSSGFGAVLFANGGTNYGLQSRINLKALITDSTTGASALTFETSTGDLAAPAERMRLDSSGRLGLGTSSPQNTFVVSNAGAEGLEIVPTGGTPNVIAFNRSTAAYAPLTLNGSVHILQTSGSERLRIDSSGRLLVGTSTARSNFFGTTLSAITQTEGTGGAAGRGSLSVINNDVSNNPPYVLLGRSGAATLGSNAAVVSGSRLGTLTFHGADGTNFVEAATVAGEVDGTPGANDMPGRLVFSTTADGAASPTERMRIDNAGFTNTFSANNAFAARSSIGAGTSILLYGGYYSATSTTSGTNSYVVWTNGNVVNTNGSYGALSDIKLKENIVDANSQWDDLKALQVRNYNFKEGQTHTQIGLVAQEVELVSPGLVTESPDRDAEGNDLGTVTKSVSYSVLYMKAVKALQEAMERIETLEAKVAALESA